MGIIAHHRPGDDHRVCCTGRATHRLPTGDDDIYLLGGMGYSRWANHPETGAHLGCAFTDRTHVLETLAKVVRLFQHSF